MRYLLAFIIMALCSCEAYAVTPQTFNGAAGGVTGNVNGAAIPASKTIVGTNASSQIVDASSATLSNNTTGTAAGLSGTPNITVNNITVNTVLAGNIAATSLTLGTGQTALYGYKEGTFTPVFTGLTVVGTPTITGTYTRIGNMVYAKVMIQPATSASAILGATYISSGLPYSIMYSDRRPGPQVIDDNLTYYNGVLVYGFNGRVYMPTWAATPAALYISFYYSTTDGF